MLYSKFLTKLELFVYYSNYSNSNIQMVLFRIRLFSKTKYIQYSIISPKPKIYLDYLWEHCSVILDKSIFFQKFVALKKFTCGCHFNKQFGPCSCHFDCIELYTTTPSGDISGHFKTFSCAALKLNMSWRGNL